MNWQLGWATPGLPVLLGTAMAEKVLLAMLLIRLTLLPGPNPRSVLPTPYRVQSMEAPPGADPLPVASMQLVFAVHVPFPLLVRAP